MLGNGRPANREGPRDPVDGLRTVDESPQDVSPNRQTECGQLIGVGNVLWSIAFHVHLLRMNVFRRYFSSSGLPPSSSVFNDDSISGHPSVEPL